MAKLLKDTQANLRLLNEKVGHLSVIFRTENATAMNNLKGSFIDVTISYGSLPSDYPTEIRPSEKEQRALETWAGHENKRFGKISGGFDQATKFVWSVIHWFQVSLSKQLLIVFFGERNLILINFAVFRETNTINDDFSNLLEIRDKAEHTLKTANEWQTEQRQRDELLNKKIAMQSEHIRCHRYRNLAVCRLLKPFIVICFCLSILLQHI